MPTPQPNRNRWSQMVGAALFVLAVSVGSHLGAQAPAPGQAESLDQILAALASYDGGIDSTAVWKLRDYVYARKDDAAGRAECEAKLLAFLKTTATRPAKNAVSHHLRVIAGDTAVPALQAMLADDSLADNALYALQQIPGDVAGRALRQAVETTGGATRIAVIGALGWRKDAAAVPALTPLLQQPAYGPAAAAALGRIGSDAAAAALAGAYGGAGAAFKPVVAAAMLTAADSALAAGNKDGALRLYETVGGDAALPVPVRRSAAIGRVNASSTVATGLVLTMLGSSDPVQQEAAVSKITDVFGADAIGQVAALLPRLTPDVQIPVLAALATYPARPVLPAILQAARSNDVAVRIAAMRALESTGGASEVPLLLETASRTSGPEQAAARWTLGMLKGRAVDEAILGRLGQGPSEAIARELLLAIADRKIFSGKPAVVTAVASASPGTRVQALKTLRVIGTPSDVPALLDVLVKAADEVERSEVEQTVAALAQKTANPDGRAGAIRTRLGTETDPEAQARLIALLPRIGDRSTLPLLRTALDSRIPSVVDAAVAAITSWPTSAAQDDILRLARTSKNETHRLLAIRGFVASVGLDQYREPAAAVADLKLAADLASRPDERKLVLGALTRFPCKEAIDLASRYLRDASVKAEAQATVAAIQKRMAGGRGGRGQ